MVIMTKNSYYEVLKNVKDAFNMEQFNECYIEEWYDSFLYIVGDVADNKLRLKGFTTDSNDKNFFHKIPEYILESCCYQTPYFVLKRIKEQEYRDRKNEPLSEIATLCEEKGFKIEKEPFDKENLSLEKSEKNSPNIKIDSYKMNAVETFPLPDDIVKEIAREKALEAKNNTKKPRNDKKRDNKDRNRRG